MVTKDRKKRTSTPSVVASDTEKQTRRTNTVKTKGTIPEPEVVAKPGDSMEELVSELGDNLVPFHKDEVCDVTVMSVTKGCVWVDVAGVAIGMIPEREFSYGTLDLKPGDVVSAFVLSLEDKEGHVVLSLRRADRERLWVTLKDKFENGEVIQGKVAEANKGGLMVEVGGVVGFLPVSQLSSNHYPRQIGSNRDELTTKLSELVGETLSLKIINFDKVTNKLIFSEKAAGDTAVEEKLSKIEVGQKVKGKITGIVDFGLFVNIGDNVEGLVHISEVSWKRVSDLRTMYAIGEEVETEVTGVSDGKVSLSLKRLSTDPWIEAASGFTVGDTVEGTITSVPRYGAFVRLNQNVDGLVHISELSDERIEDPATVVSIGQTHRFTILAVDPQAHRISLSLKAAREVAKPKASKAKKEAAVTEGPRVETESAVHNDVKEK